MKKTCSLIFQKNWWHHVHVGMSASHVNASKQWRLEISVQECFARFVKYHYFLWRNNILSGKGIGGVKVLHQRVWGGEGRGRGFSVETKSKYCCKILEILNKLMNFFLNHGLISFDPTSYSILESQYLTGGASEAPLRFQGRSYLWPHVAI